MTSTSTSADTSKATSGQDPAFELDKTTTQYLQARADQLICVACGTQYAETERSKLTNCKICDDPRQFVPEPGQQWTTLREMASKHHNVMVPHKSDPNPCNPTLLTIQTEPKFAIGQRAFLIRTPAGNVMWDCLTYLDTATISSIQKIGGLAGIVISHPHFYTAHLLWAQVFNCPIYLASDEKEWLSQPDEVEVTYPRESKQGDDMPALPGAMPDVETGSARVFIEGSVGVSMSIKGKGGKSTGVTAYKVGGHFPGSLVLSWGDRLFTADTLLPTPSGIGKLKKGMNSFVFMWSYPNMIPLPPKTLESMWAVLSRISFTSCHAAFPNLDISSPDTKQRVWESMLIQVGHEGHEAQEFQARIERMAQGLPTEGTGEELVEKGQKMIKEGHGLMNRGHELIRENVDRITREEKEEREERKEQQAEEKMFGGQLGGQVDYTNTRGSQGTGQPTNVAVTEVEGLPIEPKNTVVDVADAGDEMVGVVKGGDAALIGSVSHN